MHLPTNGQVVSTLIQDGRWQTINILTTIISEIMSFPPIASGLITFALWSLHGGRGQGKGLSAWERYKTFILIFQIYMLQVPRASLKWLHNLWKLIQRKQMPVFLDARTFYSAESPYASIKKQIFVLVEASRSPWWECDNQGECESWTFNSWAWMSKRPVPLPAAPTQDPNAEWKQASNKDFIS